MNKAIKAAAEAIHASLEDSVSLPEEWMPQAQAAIDAYFEALGQDREIFETNARHELTNKGVK